MTVTTVEHGEFARHLRAELAEKFAELHRAGTVQEVDTEYVRARIRVDFVVTARKKPAPDEPEPCCVCTRAGGGFICVGECCSVIILGEDDPG